MDILEATLMITKTALDSTRVFRIDCPALAGSFANVYPQNPLFARGYLLLSLAHQTPIKRPNPYGSKDAWRCGSSQMPGVQTTDQLFPSNNHQTTYCQIISRLRCL